MKAPAGEPREKTCWKCGKSFVTASSSCPDDGASLIDVVIGDTHDPFVGHTIADRYAVKAKLGEGGMGTVYAAHERDTGRDVALKILKDDFLRDEGIRRRFMHEARILSELEHPNAVGLDDFGQLPSGGFFMVMELLQGESLAERLTYSFLTYRDIFHYVPIICDVLDEAHARGVIHRDLKPENIYISVDADGGEIPKLIDFGVAKDLARKTVTRAGTLWGTPAYMSPEQARGDEIDGQADVYAIGIILYELICGHLPFNATTQMGYAVRHMHAPARSMLSVPGLTSPPRELDDYVLSMLSKDASRRPSSMAEVVETLRDLAHQLDDLSLLDTIPAQEVDPVALKAWFADGDDFPGASSEMPIISSRSTPAGVPHTPTQPVSTSKSQPAPEPGVIERLEHVESRPPRRSIHVALGLLAVCVLLGVAIIATGRTADPVDLSTSKAEPVTENPTPSAIDRATPAPSPAEAREVVAAAEAALDASAALDLLREREVDAVGAAAIQAAGVIMLAQDLCSPVPAATKAASPTKRRKTTRRTPKTSRPPDDSLENAVKTTF